MSPQQAAGAVEIVALDEVWGSRKKAWLYFAFSLILKKCLVQEFWQAGLALRGRFGSYKFSTLGNIYVSHTFRSSKPYLILSNQSTEQNLIQWPFMFIPMMSKCFWCLNVRDVLFICIVVNLVICGHFCQMWSHLSHMVTFVKCGNTRHMKVSLSLFEHLSNFFTLVACGQTRGHWSHGHVLDNFFPSVIWYLIIASSERP